MHLYKIIFSPTGGTEKVANQLVQSFGGETDTIDLTDFAAGFHQISFSEEDLCICLLYTSLHILGNAAP